MKIFHLTDLHLHTDNNVLDGINYQIPIDRFGNNYIEQQNLFDNWVDMINDNDIVLITGDTIEGNTFKKVKPILTKIDNLPGFKFMIKGNHCKWYNESNMYQFKTIKNCENQIHYVKNLVIFGSRGQSSMTQYKRKDNYYYENILQMMSYLYKINKLKNNNYISIFLTHLPPSPDVLKLIKKYEIDYVFYGHLHYSDDKIESYDKTKLIMNLPENNLWKPKYIDYIIYKKSGFFKKKYIRDVLFNED